MEFCRHFDRQCWRSHKGENSTWCVQWEITTDVTEMKGQRTDTLAVEMTMTRYNYSSQYDQMVSLFSAPYCIKHLGWITS